MPPETPPHVVRCNALLLAGSVLATFAVLRLATVQQPGRGMADSKGLRDYDS